MKILEMLRSGVTLQELESKYGIKSNCHEDGRVILNYDQIDSYNHRFTDFVRECRGLVTHKDGWPLIARAFDRFFNLGEYPKEQNQFVWEDCLGYHKEDGSLIIVYRWNDKWHLNTRNSFGDGEVNNSGMSWRDLFTIALPGWELNLHPHYTYCFELCSRYNKIVRDYKEPTAYLLTCFDGSNECSPSFVSNETSWIGACLPEVNGFGNEVDAQRYIEELVKNDKTFEGLVLRDIHDRRIKIKSAEYIALHRLNNNGNILHPKNILPFILKGEEDEVLQYFPEISEQTLEIKAFVDKMKEELDNIWFSYGDIKNRKRFALAVKDHPLSGYLFEARKKESHPVEEMLSSPELLLKLIIRNKE